MADFYITQPLIPEDTELLVKLEIDFESSDHDGYCSGGECEYTQEGVTRFVPLPECFIDSEIGTVLPTHDTFWSYLWEKKCCGKNDRGLYDIAGGSYSCQMDNNSQDSGLDQHTVRIVVMNAQVVEYKEFEQYTQN